MEGPNVQHLFFRPRVCTPLGQTLRASWWGRCAGAGCPPTSQGHLCTESVSGRAQNCLRTAACSWGVPMGSLSTERKNVSLTKMRLWHTVPSNRAIPGRRPGKMLTSNERICILNIRVTGSRYADGRRDKQKGRRTHLTQYAPPLLQVIPGLWKWTLHLELPRHSYYSLQIYKTHF